MHTPPADDAVAACSDCLPRRAFLRRSMMVAAAALLAEACGNGYHELLGPSLLDLGPSGLPLRLRDVPELATIGGIAVIPAGASRVAVVRRGQYQYDAWWLSCPHQNFPLDVAPTGFHCANHGARFSNDGRWQGGRSTGPLSAVPFTYDPIVGTLILGVEPSTPPTRTRAPLVMALALATVPELQRVGGIALFGLGNGYPFAVVRIATAEYLALSASCPHRQYVVDPAPSGFVCPGHGATFSDHGVWTGGTNTTNLPVLASQYDVTNGTLTVTVP